MGPESRRIARNSRSPWIGTDTHVDPVRWAKLLRRAHELALAEGNSPSILRAVVAQSWERSAAAGVNPDRPAPRMLDDAETARALAQNPISHLLPTIESLLADATEEGRYFAALSDANGVLLWASGHSGALEIAEAPAFLPGHLASEGAVGTNAIGTALVLDHPVQIFSAEHFSRLLHGWTCSAAPIHDPETHEILGVLDLSGEFRSGHPHSLPLVGAVAQVVEDQLAAEQAHRDERLRQLFLDRIAAESRLRSALVSRTGRVLAASPRGWLGRRIDLPPEEERLTLADGTEVTSEPIGREGARIVFPAALHGVPRRPPRVRLEVLGRRRARIMVGGQAMTLSPRHSEIAVLLMLQPAGLSGKELADELYGPGSNRITVRAEISRLRQLLGDALASNPYRFEADLESDWGSVQRLIQRGDVTEAVESYPGPLLVGSEVPAIETARGRTERAIATPLQPPPPGDTRRAEG
ncbi:MAG TPA: GAF domain-containing protein [Solirubrobacterales bacterium]|nr:GAF domain-containing protein [Solirubrobacterales bacterium]